MRLHVVYAELWGSTQPGRRSGIAWGIDVKLRVPLEAE